MPKAILSSNENLDYLFYLPITSFVWNYFDFETINVFVEENLISEDIKKLVFDTLNKKTKSETYFIKTKEPYRSETISQFSRFYGACLIEKPDEYLIIGDVDMIPLSSYLNRDFDKMNLYGYDLTGFTQYPMCYIGMWANKWQEFMGIKYGDNLEEIIYRDLSTQNKALGQDFYEYWDTDQDFITKKIKEYGEYKFQSILRGYETNGLAYRRVDRANWDWDKNLEYIDSHMLRVSYKEENFSRVFELIQHTCKNVDCSWMNDYHKKFISLLEK